jgi:hypothetical protein
MEAHPGLVQVYNGTVVEVCLGAVEAHPGALETHPGPWSLILGPWRLILGPWRLTLEPCMLTIKCLHAQPGFMEDHPVALEAHYWSKKILEISRK